MDYDDKFTLLSKEQIKNGYVLKEKYKTNIPTDYASFLCGLLNSKKCTSWIYPSENNKPCYIDENGQIKPYKRDLEMLNDVFIRPVLPYYDLKSIQPKGKVFYDENHILIIEYGWYPQDSVEYSISKKLQSLYWNHSLERLSNHFHHFTAVKQLESLPEYEFEGKYYVEVRTIWFEVKPVRWIVDEENHLLVSEKCLISRVPYLYPNMDFNSALKRTNIYHFLNHDFKLDLLQKHNSLLVDKEMLFGDYFSQDVDEPLKFIKDYMYASKHFEKGEGLDDDISYVHSIGNSAFEDCKLKELELPLSVHNIGYKAFCHCYDLNLVLPSSLVYLNLCKMGDDAEDTRKFNATFSSCDSLKIYGHMFYLLNFESYKRFKNIQYEELNDLTEYVLSNYKIKISEAIKEFFDDKCKEIILQLDKEPDFNEIPKWKEMLIEDIIKYLYERKPYLRLKKYNNLRNEIIEHITNFYFQKKLINKQNEEIINEPTNNTNKMPLQIMNNEFESKSEEEVLELITNLKISKIDSIDVKTIRSYGEELKPFLDYISNYFSKIIFENNINEKKIMVVKKELGNYNGKIENIDNSFLDNLNKFIIDAITKFEDKENKFENLKKIIHAYILKLEEVYKELNNHLISTKSDNIKDATDNHLINNIIENKKTALEKNMETILQEYMQLSIMLVNEDNFLNNLTIIRDNLLPEIVLAISLTSDNINKRKQVAIMKEIYSLLDNKKDRKRKINLLQGVKEILNKSILETKSSNKNDEVVPLDKLHNSDDVIANSAKYMHLVDYMNPSENDSKKKY